MSDAVTAIAAAAAQPSSAAQPPAAQSARFEAQLHAPTVSDPAYYEAQPAEESGAGGNWHAVMDEVGQVGQQLRTQLLDLDRTAPKMGTALDPQQAEALRVMEEMSDKAVKLSGSMMNYSFVTAAGRAVDDSVRTLYQQQG